MEYFDFHTHAFVDFLAERALSGLEDTSGIKPATDGTLSGLKKKMQQTGISRAMLLPVATKPSQQHNINNWAAEIMDGSIFCCGSIHPDAEDKFEELERIHSLGLYGIKFHSEYQHFCPDEERMIPLYKRAAELGMFVVFHGGWDPFGEGEVRAEPKRIAKAAEKCPELTIIAAHMGGLRRFDEAEDWLAGRYENLYMDTGVVYHYITDEQAFRIIRKQGADKILFGSDCPWDDPANEIALLNRLPLSDPERSAVFHGNAEKLISKHDKALR